MSDQVPEGDLTTDGILSAEQLKAYSGPRFFLKDLIDAIQGKIFGRGTPDLGDDIINPDVRILRRTLINHFSDDKPIEFRAIGK